jgi:hypothetical protein
MSGVQQVVFQNQRSFGAPPGQQAYTSPGTYTWVAPAGVTVVSVVAVGAGAGAQPTRDQAVVWGIKTISRWPQAVPTL